MVRYSTLKYIRPLLLAALLPTAALRLSAEAGMTLRTAKLISRYAESLRQAPTAAQATATALSVAAAGEDNTVGATLVVDSTLEESALNALGITVGTRVSNVATIRASAAQLRQVAQLPGVLFINADNRAHKLLNVAGPLVKADSVHAGLGGLPQGYTGKGTVVGIVDWGFDYTHPMFYDSLGNLRIVSVWNQTSSSGPCISSYNYGSIYSTQEELESRRYSATDESHGTHVAGIAAGGGGSKPYRGVAPEADLVLVQLRSGTDSEIIDAISYVFGYAQAAGKPAVVNLSMGSQWGPHDGTSPFDRALGAMVGEGRIAVGAAGNDGELELHASYTFSSANNTVRTVVDVAEDISNTAVWMSVGQHVEWTVELWDAAKHTRLEQLNGGAFYSTKTGKGLSSQKFTASGSDVTVSGSGYNYYSGDTRGIVDLELTNKNPAKYAVVLALKATAGTVHLWNMGNADENIKATFSTLNSPSYTWMAGNTDCTLSEVGGTASKIISVGAYNSRKLLPLGAVSYFSSRGPTTDRRVKPDLVAPGTYMISSVNSGDAAYQKPSGTYKSSIVDEEQKGGSTYYYAAMSGTSMSTPMVTGAVALLLQQCPSLTPDSVTSLLQRSALVDAAMAATPPAARGAGKLNALGAVKENRRATSCPSIPAVPREFCGGTLLSVAQATAQGSLRQLAFSVSPNPSSGELYVETEEEGELTLSLYSITGSLLYTCPAQRGGRVKLPPLPQGIYLVQLSSGKLAGVQKIMLR